MSNKDEFEKVLRIVDPQDYPYEKEYADKACKRFFAIRTVFYILIFGLTFCSLQSGRLFFVDQMTRLILMILLIGAYYFYLSQKRSFNRELLQYLAVESYPDRGLSRYLNCLPYMIKHQMTWGTVHYYVGLALYRMGRIEKASGCLRLMQESAKAKVDLFLAEHLKQLIALYYLDYATVEQCAAEMNILYGGITKSRLIMQTYSRSQLAGMCARCCNNSDYGQIYALLGQPAQTPMEEAIRNYYLYITARALNDTENMERFRGAVKALGGTTWYVRAVDEGFAYEARPADYPVFFRTPEELKNAKMMDPTRWKYLILGFVVVALLFAVSLLAGCGSEQVTGKGPSAGQEEVAESWTDPLEDLPEDFIFGMDASSLLAEEKSGVTYYDFDGNEADPLKTFADSGINYIRLRVWNDPYDADGNGYGGGNNDLPTAIELGKRATGYGMKVMIDFHYSDFWADPKRQNAPKAWEGMTVDEKANALYEYTRDSLKELLDAGVDVGMVQIGNEINYGMSGETKADNVITLLKSGSRAVREVSSAYDKDIAVVVHYTRIQDKADVMDLVKNLVDSELDFDMIGMSYYPFWDGSMDNMSRVLELIQERYNKQVFLAETSYCYTTEDGDGFGNSLAAKDLVAGYPASAEGQATMIRDICKQVNSVGGLGIFYWEGAWIPVGPATSDNSSIWEQYGSGWASSYASDYDPEDAALYYGGSSWDNQAFFDFQGHPLESLKVFNYMKNSEAN